MTCTHLPSMYKFADFKIFQNCNYWFSGSGDKPASPGHSDVKLYSINTKSWKYFNFEERNAYAHSCYEFEIDGTQVDLVDGRIKFNKDSDTIAEHIAVSFSVSLLHVLCRPSKPNLEPGQQGNLKQKIIVELSNLILAKLQCLTQQE